MMMMMMTTTMRVIPDVILLTLQALRSILIRFNHERALYFLPAIIWVSLLMVVGVIGKYTFCVVIGY
jgi:uncharacterized membrane protein